MDDQEQPQTAKRGVVARIGICLLDLLSPGLGLLRLGRYRAGFLLTMLAWTGPLAVVATYALAERMTYGIYFSVVAVAVAMLLIAYVGSIFLTWRWSAQVLPRQGWWWRWYSLVGLLVVVWLFNHNWLDFARSRYRSFNAASPSLAPTLVTGDIFLAQMRDFGPVSRGDVVIVRQGKVEYVRRVAAIPGDTIAMQHDVVVLNGHPTTLVPLGTAKREVDDGTETDLRFREIFPGETTAHEIRILGPRPQDTIPAVKLGPDDYFLLGDNRDDSIDSRFDQSMDGLGIVVRNRIEGRVLFRFWRKSSGFGEGPI